MKAAALIVLMCIASCISLPTVKDPVSPPSKSTLYIKNNRRSNIRVTFLSGSHTIPEGSAACYVIAEPTPFTVHVEDTIWNQDSADSPEIKAIKGQGWVMALGPEGLVWAVNSLQLGPLCKGG